jgi:hypothetical protein
MRFSPDPLKGFLSYQSLEISASGLGCTGTKILPFPYLNAKSAITTKEIIDEDNL